MMKQLSDSFAAEAMKSELSLKSGDSVDKHMDVETVLDRINTIEKKYSVELQNATTDEMKADIEANMGRERFKTMKKLDKANERASPKQIARRQSLQ